MVLDKPPGRAERATAGTRRGTTMVGESERRGTVGHSERRGTTMWDTPHEGDDDTPLEYQADGTLGPIATAAEEEAAKEASKSA